VQVCEMSDGAVSRWCRWIFWGEDLGGLGGFGRMGERTL